MQISTPAELGAVIRVRRKALGLSQADLARRLPASQKWLSEVENGKVSAEIGQVMRLLSLLGITLTAGIEAKAPAIRFRRAATMGSPPSLEEHAALAQAAFKRWDLT